MNGLFDLAQDLIIGWGGIYDNSLDPDVYPVPDDYSPTRYRYEPAVPGTYDPDGFIPIPPPPFSGVDIDAAQLDGETGELRLLQGDSVYRYQRSNSNPTSAFYKTDFGTIAEYTIPDTVSSDHILIFSNEGNEVWESLTIDGYTDPDDGAILQIKLYTDGGVLDFNGIIENDFLKGVYEYRHVNNGIDAAEWLYVGFTGLSEVGVDSVIGENVDNTNPALPVVQKYTSFQNETVTLVDSEIELDADSSTNHTLIVVYDDSVEVNDTNIVSYASPKKGALLLVKLTLDAFQPTGVLTICGVVVPYPQASNGLGYFFSYSGAEWILVGITKLNADGTVVQDLSSPSTSSVLSTEGLVTELVKKLNIEGTSYVFVEGTGTPEENGAKLIAAVATGKYVYLVGGVYNVGDTQLVPTNGISGIIHHHEGGSFDALTTRVIGNSDNPVIIAGNKPLCSVYVTNQGAGASIALGEAVLMEGVYAAKVVMLGADVGGLISSSAFIEVGDILFNTATLDNLHFTPTTGTISLSNGSTFKNSSFKTDGTGTPYIDAFIASVDSTSLVTNCNFEGIGSIAEHAVIGELLGQVTYCTFDIPLMMTGFNSLTQDATNDPEGIVDGNNISVGNAKPILSKIQNEAIAIPDPDGTNQDEILEGILALLRTVTP